MGVLWWTVLAVISCTTAVLSSEDPLTPADTGSGSGSGGFLFITTSETPTDELEPTITADDVTPTPTTSIAEPDVTTTVSAATTLTTTIRGDVQTSVSDVVPTDTQTSSLSPTTSQTSSSMLTETSSISQTSETSSIVVQTSSVLTETSLVSQTSSSVSILDTSTSSVLTTQTSPVPLSVTPTSTILSTVTQQQSSSSVLATDTPSTTSVSTFSQTSSISLSVIVSSTNTPFPTASVVPTAPMTTNPTPTDSSIFQPFLDFFRNASQEAIIGIAVGGALILILLAILLLLCCCCVCSKVRRRKRQKYDVHNSAAGFSISNPSASTSLFANGTSPTHYQHHLGNSYEGLDRYDLHQLEAEASSQPQYNRYQPNMFRETAIDIGGPSQPQHSQLSVGTDIFREGPLPKLSPLSYSSQINHGLSVDNIDQSATRLHSSLGNIGGSPLHNRRFPCSSPSLRVPTRMALSLQNEESKSAHGSRVSIQGSRTSFQGSRPSIVGSRSHIHSSSISRDLELSSSLLSGHREEEDNLSLPLSDQTSSPLPQQNSLESMDLPTRDSPLDIFPIATSRSIGHGKQDFASLTCIPNQLAIEAHLNSTPEKQDLFSEKPVEVQSLRRRSKDFGALTTLDGNEADGEVEVRPQKIQEPIPEEEVVKKTESKVVPEKSPDNKSSSIKKPRSRAMSKLEKLTSLEYIRASLRIKKKRVSFENDKNVSAMSSTKKGKDAAKELVVTNKGAIDHQDSPPTLTNEDFITSPDSTLDGRYRSGHRHSITGDMFSPTDYREDQFGDPAWPPPRSYTEYPFGFLQLSQPTFYGGGHMMQPAYQQHGYPQLSQQYYPQMRQGYVPHTHHVPVGSPFRRSEYTAHNGSHYRGSGTPDFSDITTPEHESYSSKERRTPDQLLENEKSSRRSSYNDYPGHGYPPMDIPQNGYDPGNRKTVSPDTLTETSTTSAGYHTRSPDLFGEHGIIPSPHTHNMDVPSLRAHHLDNFVSEVYPQGPSSDHYAAAAGGGVGVPTYPVDLHYTPRGAAASDMESYGVGYSHDNPRHSMADHYERESRQFNNHPHHHRESSFEHNGGNRTPEQYLTSPKHYAVRSNRRTSSERRLSGYSESSTASDKMADTSASSSTSKNKVSWSTEVIEYPRTPSDMDESDFDLNQL